MKSKTIILSSDKKFINNSPRAIITFIDENNWTSGKIRLYNMQKLNPSVKLGMYYEKKVYSANLSFKDNAYNFKLDQKLELNQNIFCALIETTNKNEVLLSGGTSDGFYFTDEQDDTNFNQDEITSRHQAEIKSPTTEQENDKFKDNIASKKEDTETINNDNVAEKQNFEIPQTNAIIDENLQEVIEEEKLIDECMNKSNINDLEINSNAINFECDNTNSLCKNCDCKECAYKEYFYSQHSYKEKNHTDTANTNFCDQSFVKKEPNKHFCCEEDNNSQSKSENTNLNDQCKPTKDNYNPNNDNDTKTFIPYTNTNTHQNCSNGLEIDYQNSERIDQSDNNYESQNLEKSHDYIKINSNKTTTDTENNNRDDASEDFINNIAEQLDEMFLTYPTDETLTKIIPNSKIVRVTDSLDNSSYIVGVIYENNEIAYLLYGVPSRYNEKAPAEFGDNYQWLPLNPDDPMSDGYFLLYQDASNGKLVPIKVE